MLSFNLSVLILIFNFFFGSSCFLLRFRSSENCLHDRFPGKIVFFFFQINGGRENKIKVFIVTKLAVNESSSDIIYLQLAKGSTLFLIC